MIELMHNADESVLLNAVNSQWVYYCTPCLSMSLHAMQFPR